MDNTSKLLFFLLLSIGVKLFVLQISIVQWILVAIAFVLSGGVLGLTLGPELTKKAPKFGSVLLVAVVGLHLLVRL